MLGAIDLYVVAEHGLSATRLQQSIEVWCFSWNTRKVTVTSQHKPEYGRWQVYIGMIWELQDRIKLMSNNNVFKVTF